jgi:hypothetical protein
MADDADRLQITTEFNRALRQDTLQPEGVHPVAEPVDTFVDNNGGNQLEQLARSLSGISPEVSKLSDFLSDKGHAQDEAQANSDVSAAVRNGANTYADAVKSGQIPASASPYYRMYAQKQMGQLMAGKMSSDFEADATRDLAGITSLSQFDEYQKQYQSKWLQDHGGDNGNLAFSEGYDPHANAAMADARSRAAELIGKNLQAQTVGALIQTHGQTIRTMLQQGASHEQIAAVIDSENNAAIASGVRGDQVNIATSEAIGNVAEANKDSSVLDLAGKVKAGTGFLGDTEAFAQTRTKSDPYITRAQMDADSIADKQKRAAMEQTRGTALTSIQVKLASNPQSDIRPELKALEDAHDYQGVEAAEGFQKAAVKQVETDDYSHFSTAMADALDPDDRSLTLSQVHSLAANHLVTPEHANQLADILERKAKAATDPTSLKSVYSDFNFKTARSALKADFTSSFAPGATSSPDYAQASVELANQAIALHSNPAYLGASPQVQMQMMNTVRENIVKVYAPGTISRHAGQAAPVNSGPSNEKNADRLDAEALHADLASPSHALTPTTKAMLQRRHITDAAGIQSFLSANGILPQPETK